MKDQNKPGEFDLISRYFAPLAAAEPGALGLLDDAAVLEPEPGQRLVVTTDSLVAGIHFPADEDPRHVAARVLGVNLSDLAAMGARPWAYTLSVAWPKDWDTGWVEGFAEELGRQQERYGLHLVGGDTVSTPGPLTLCLTAFGTVAENAELRRSSARPNDDIYVSGTIGDAALGLKVLQDGLEGLLRAMPRLLWTATAGPGPGSNWAGGCMAWPMGSSTCRTAWSLTWAMSPVRRGAWPPLTPAGCRCRTPAGPPSPWSPGF